jgi:N-succinyldiaminopimelate aminotransferase
MNPRLDLLERYPFERLAALKAGVTPPAHLSPIGMSIGEPKAPPPKFLLETLARHLDGVGSYPSTLGLPEFRASAARWLGRRFPRTAGRVDPATMVLPVNGTREALFSFVQACIDPAEDAIVAMPNPFYQIYEGAALLAGAEPWYLDTTPDNDFRPDLDAVPASVWRRCRILFLCSPGNPTGAILSRAYLEHALELAERHDFVIAADECYAELYLDPERPSPSLLEAAVAAGRDRFERCIVFHSLSKRSSMPGLRSGFVAGDPELLARFLLYRTYHGSAMSIPTQLVSIAAWDDDAHAAGARALYRENFDRVLPILGPLLDLARPDGAFYLWPRIDGDDATFTRRLFAAQNVTLLPGSYLARSGAAAGARAATGSAAGRPDDRVSNPGYGRVRISLVAGPEECEAAAGRIRDFVLGTSSS